LENGYHFHQSTSMFNYDKYNFPIHPKPQVQCFSLEFYLCVFIIFLLSISMEYYQNAVCHFNEGKNIIM